MGLVINTNIASLIASRNVGRNEGYLQKSISHLSSGLRVATAADDAAGLAISEKLRADTRSYQQAARNSNDGISSMQVAEGALTEVSNILVRMKELAVQSANGTISDRIPLDAEFQQLKSEVVRIGSSTKFNGTALLQGGYNTTLQVGLTSTETLGIDLSSVDLRSQANAAVQILDTTHINAATAAGANNAAYTGVVTSSGVYSPTAGGNPSVDRVFMVKVNTTGIAGVATGQVSDDGGATWTAANSFTFGTGATAVVGASAVDYGVKVAFSNSGTLTANDVFTINADAARGLTSQAAAQQAMTSIDADIAKVSQNRGTVGSYQNRMEYTVANLQIMAQNSQASESQIRDADFAVEMAQFTKHQVLQQAGVAILSQANQITQSVLSLLK
jgi:flagellin